MNADREMTALEQALQNAADDASLADDFYDVLLKSDLVVGTRGTNSAASNGNADDLIILIDNDEIAHLPVFASDAAMDTWDESDKVGRVTIQAAELIAGIDPNMRLVLNPGLGVTKVFDAKELNMLRRMVRRRARDDRRAAAKTTKVAFSAVTQVSEAVQNKLGTALAARRTLKAIYLLDVEDKNLPAGHYMLVLIDVRPSDFEAVGDRVIDLFANMFEEGTPVEIGCLQEEPMWADIVSDHGVPPIYPKAH